MAISQYEGELIWTAVRKERRRRGQKAPGKKKKLIEGRQVDGGEAQMG